MLSQAETIPTLCHSFDKLLQGGFHAGQISLIYGEASTGKTTIAVQCAVNCARRLLKTLYVDADNVLSSTRLSQIYGYEKDIAPSILIFTPTNFDEQAHLIERLSDYITLKVALVVVDTITTLYRLELGSSNKTFTLNRELNRQLAYLAQLVEEKKIAAIITSQVHAPLNREETEPVANRLLKFWSKTIIKLKQTPRTGIREAVLEKFPNVKHPQAHCFFKLVDKGIQDLKN